MKRRDVLKALPIGAAFAAVPFSFGGFAARAFGKSPLLDALTNAQSADGKVLVVINLQGGNDGLNTIIPYNEPLYFSNRKTVGFKTSDAAMLDGYKLKNSGLAMNPNMDDGANAKLHKLFTDGKLAIMQNVGYADPNLSHFRSTDIWNTASDSNMIISTGWIGRYLQTQAPGYPTGIAPGDDPLAVQIGASLSPIFQGDSVQMGIAVSDPSKYSAASAYADDPSPATNAGVELDFVRSILTQSDVYGKRFNSLFPAGSPPKSKVDYTGVTKNPLAMQLQRVAWCIQAGMKTKVYFVNLGSFDTHVQQQSNAQGSASGQGLLLRYLAEAISVFQADLEAGGVADKVIGMTYSEFGRRVNENGSQGTDHGTCAPHFIFGSQVNGDLYGPNPDLVNLDSNLDLVWKIDYRQLYASVLGDWFGLSQPLRKSILSDQSSSGEKFNFAFTPNGGSKAQSLFKNPLAVGSSLAEPENFVLYQNYPNPFNPTTTIKFALAATSAATLEVFDSRGSLIRTIVNDRLTKGEHEFNFDASRLASGTYFYRLDAAGTVQTKTMTLVK